MSDLYRLGASLYIPAIRDDIVAIANAEKYGNLRSMIFCTEDSIGERDVPSALARLESSLSEFKSVPKRLRFIRARNPRVLEKILAMRCIERIDGFVLPKVRLDTLVDYLSLLKGTCFMLMITLETIEVFDAAKMVALRDFMLDQGCRERILALRIGGNDLLNLLRIRRPRDRTIYQTPIGSVIANLVTTFKPYGFELTAPVFEYLDDTALLCEELRQDLAFGLFGKTAIHPSQVGVIEAFYRVSREDVDIARSLLHPDSNAVFRMHNSMCEVATHSNWAKETMRRAQIFGIVSG